VIHEFNSAEEWEAHIEEAHCDVIPAPQRPVLAELSKRQMIGPLACPLCDFSTGTMAANVDDHILKHLHEFSLWALPNGVGQPVDQGSTKFQVSSSASLLSYTKEEWTTSIILEDSTPTPSQAFTALEHFGLQRDRFSQELQDSINAHRYVLGKMIERYKSLDWTTPEQQMLGQWFRIILDVRETCAENFEDTSYIMKDGKEEKTDITDEMVANIVTETFLHLDELNTYLLDLSGGLGPSVQGEFMSQALN
jgi:hypothetical protein